MGWRVSIYKADKNNPISINVDEYGYESADINGERIAYDCGTDTWCTLKHSNEEFKKEIKCLKEDCDQDFYSITKNGFKMMILDFRNRIIKNIKKSIEVTETPEIKETKYDYAYTPDALQYLKEELREWETSWGDKDDEHYMNIVFAEDRKLFGISGSWLYKYAMYDMLEIYKYFDWDNYTMVIYGG